MLDYPLNFLPIGNIVATIISVISLIYASILNISTNATHETLLKGITFRGVKTTNIPESCKFKLTGDSLCPM